MHNIIKTTILFMAAIIAGCGASIPTITPFKMDIQQGNVVTSEMLLKLRPGMTKSQVQYIMGAPLLVDSFHSDRWDYFYQLRKQGKVLNQRRVILDFDGDALTRVRGDVVPEGTDIDTLIAKERSKASGGGTVGSAKGVAVIKPVIEATVVENEALVEQGKMATSKSMKGGLLDPVLGVRTVSKNATKPAKVTKPARETTNPSNITSKHRKVLIFERKLDLSRIRALQPVSVQDALPEVKPKAVSKASKAQRSKGAPPYKEEPSFFERILEKVGF